MNTLHLKPHRPTTVRVRPALIATKRRRRKPLPWIALICVVVGLYFIIRYATGN